MLYGLDVQNRKICQIHSNSFCPSRLKYHRICDREFFSQNIHSFSFILKFLPPENLSTCMVASDCLLPSSWWKHVVYAIATNHKMNCWLDNFVFYDKLCEKKQLWWFRKSCFLSNCHKLDGKSHSFSALAEAISTLSAALIASTSAAPGRVVGVKLFGEQMCEMCWD